MCIFKKRKGVEKGWRRRKRGKKGRENILSYGNQIMDRTIRPVYELSKVHGLYISLVNETQQEKVYNLYCSLITILKHVLASKIKRRIKKFLTLD